MEIITKQWLDEILQGVRYSLSPSQSGMKVLPAEARAAIAQSLLPAIQAKLAALDVIKEKAK